MLPMHLYVNALIVVETITSKIRCCFFYVGANLMPREALLKGVVSVNVSSFVFWGSRPSLCHPAKNVRSAGKATTST